MMNVSVALVAALCLRPSFVPDVKDYRAEADAAAFEAKGLVVRHADQEQCRIGADEIPGAAEKRVWDGAGCAERGVYIAVAGTPAGDALAKAFALDVPDHVEGYAIRARADGRVAIVGHDAVGALYGAVTFAQMVTDGRIRPATVRDWPDVRLRGGMDVRMVIGMQGLRDPNRRNNAALYMRGIDELMRAKINVSFDYCSPYTNPTTPEFFDSVSKVIRYAEARGVRLLIYGSTGLYDKFSKPKGLKYSEWPCVKGTTDWSESYYCWSDDRMIEESAARFADQIARMGSTKPVIVLHPVDGGSVEDPEYWSRRCAKCKARWPEDARWKASVNLFNIMNRAIKARLPGAEVSSCIYPYSLQLLKAKPDDPRRALIDRNFIAYWQKLDEGITDKRFGFSSWTYDADLQPKVGALVRSGRPIQLCDCYCMYAGLVSTSARFAASVVDGDSIYKSFSYGSLPDWEDWLLLSAYLWNAKTPGAETYHGFNYYDPLKDHAGPQVVIDEVLRPACSRFWGPEVAPDMMDFLLSGVLPKYIEKPTSSVRYWNGIRKDANYDPNGGTVSMVVTKAKPLADDAARMRGQIAPAERAVAAIDRAFAKISGLKETPRTALYARANMAPMWLLYAKAQAALREGGELFFQGRIPEARETLVRGSEELARDRAALKARRARMQRACPDCEWMAYMFWRPEVTDLEARFAEQLEAVRFASGPSAELTRERAAAYRPDRRAAKLASQTREAEVWEGEMVLTSRVERINTYVYVKPGTKVVFGTGGTFQLFGGKFLAEGADFVAYDTMTNALRINCEKPLTVELVGCTFRGFRSFGKGQCPSPIDKCPGFFRVYAAASGARIENCTFENCSEFVVQQFARPVIRRNLFTGGNRGLHLRWAGNCVVTENVCRDLSGAGIVCEATSGLVGGNSFLRCETAFWAWDMGSCQILGNASWDVSRQFWIGDKVSGAVIAGNRDVGSRWLPLFRDDPKKPCLFIDNVPAIHPEKKKK